jgi:pyruvate formate lyase activating enzyme
MENEKGLVFHIIHGSFVDGYGIRTTVFLKGCPLKCLWCCNPEGQQLVPEIKLTASACNACGKCLSVCPEQAIRINPKTAKTRIEVNRSLCSGCGQCFNVCPAEALSYFGKYYSVDDLIEIVIKDEQYYRSSGGGVTIGGGEPTFQPRFTYRFLKKCQENYLHVAVDTCGYTTSREGFRILEESDLLLYDLKGLDPQQHLRSTGVSNKVILDNLHKLNDMGKHIIIRLPLIPGYTDSETNLQDTAVLLAKLKSVERVDLLAYHEYGTIKYQQLGREYPLQVRPLTDARLADIKDIFLHCGLNVQIGG